jgi:hypothetical protein
MKKTLIAAAMAGSIALTGCFGSFTAVKKLYNWNDSFGNKWVEWAVFLAFSVLPVYEIFALGDVLIFNSVEFWTGGNPLAAGDAYHGTDANGNQVAAVKMDDGSLYMQVTNNEGKQSELVMQQDEEILRIIDAKTGVVLQEAAYAGE